MSPTKIFALLTCFLIFSLEAKAGVIECKDAAGKVVFTDTPSKCANKEAINQNKEQPVANTSTFYDEIPDLVQTLKIANFEGNGEQFCGPVAVSNSLVWFEKNKEQDYQINLVKKLSSADYMNTNVESGTNVTQLTQGVHKYATERWGDYKKLEYSGWSKAPKQFRSALAQPTLAWMTQALHRKGTVWINIGWYNADGINYVRAGGHWVTLVGYEQGKLVIHDPAPKAGKAPSNQFVTLKILNGGQLIEGRKTANARDHFAIESGMKISSKGNIGIIDGAVKFELR